MRPPDAAIIDLVLPDGDGVEVCRSIREWSEMPILVLSAVGDEREKVRALEAGADDYVTKPFGPDELVARLQAALRRVGPPAETSRSIEAGRPRDRPRRHTRVSGDGEEIHLTPTEFDLLRHLVRNRGRLLTHRALLARSGARASRTTPRCCACTSPTCGARSSRSPARPRLIRTDPGVGYRFAG